MPDANGIMTPQEIGEMGINAATKRQALASAHMLAQKQAAIFEQSLRSGELKYQMDHVDLDMKNAAKKLLDYMDNKGVDSKTGQPIKLDLDPATMRYLSLFPGFQNQGVAPTGSDELRHAGYQEAVTAGAGVQAGVLPSADTLAQGDVARSGQATTERIATNNNEVTMQQTRASVAQWLRNNGGNLNVVGDQDVLDPAVMAQAMAGRTPNDRIQAIAGLMSAETMRLKTASDNALARVDAARITADGKNKFAVMKIMSETLGRANVAMSAAANSGNTDAMESAMRTVAMSADGLSQAMTDAGYAVPGPSAPKEPWYSAILKHFGIGKPVNSAVGPVSQSKLEEAIRSGNLDMNVSASEGATPAPGGIPQSAPPTDTNLPAPMSPNSSLLYGTEFDQTPSGTPASGYLSPEETAAIRARLGARQLDPGSGQNGIPPITSPAPPAAPPAPAPAVSAPPPPTQSPNYLALLAEKDKSAHPGALGQIKSLRNDALGVPGALINAEAKAASKLLMGALKVSGLYTPAPKLSDTKLIDNRNTLLDQVLASGAVPADQQASFQLGLLRLPLDVQLRILKLAAQKAK